MQILELTEKTLNENRIFTGGFESQIYVYDDNKLLKIYYDTDNFDKKYKHKIELFSSLALPYTAYPEELLKLNGKNVGYSMKKIKGFTLENARIVFTYDQIIHIINKLNSILEQLHSLNITIGDLNPGNIITDGNDVYILDIVGAKTEKYDFSEKSSTMCYYLEKNNNSSKNIDNFMLNLLTVYLLNEQLNYNKIIPLLESIVLNYFTDEKYRDITIKGVTDNLECLNVVFDMFSDEATNEQLLIRELNNYTSIHQK